MNYKNNILLAIPWHRQATVDKVLKALWWNRSKLYIYDILCGCTSISTCSFQLCRSSLFINALQKITTSSEKSLLLPAAILFICSSTQRSTPGWSANIYAVSQIVFVLKEKYFPTMIRTKDTIAQKRAFSIALNFKTYWIRPNNNGFKTSQK